MKSTAKFAPDFRTDDPTFLTASLSDSRVAFKAGFAAVEAPADAKNPTASPIPSAVSIPISARPVINDAVDAAQPRAAQFSSRIYHCNLIGK